MDRSANKLLKKLTEADWVKFRPLLTTVEIQSGEILMEPDTKIQHVWFPLDCACSMIAVPDERSAIEVGMFGREGMSNMVVRVGDRTFMRTIAFITGQALRIDTKDFVAALASLPSLNEVTLRHKETFTNQLAQGSAANGAFSIEQRLARWLLMAFDRTPENRLPIVHDFCPRFDVLDAVGAALGRNHRVARDRRHRGRQGDPRPRHPARPRQARGDRRGVLRVLRTHLRFCHELRSQPGPNRAQVGA
jgi:hypothetical protein